VALAAAAAQARAAHAPEREALLEECALWCDDRSGEETDSAWDGTPLGIGVRLPDRARVAAPFLAGPGALERGEVFVVHGWSETVARALEAAQRAGLAPEAIVSEGGADLGGRRLARRLVAAGVAVRFIYDAALFDAVRRADRVWIGTDAIGARTFVARLGTRMLLQEARRADVRVTVLATSDKLVPGGDLVLPRWGEDEPWLLWERPPMGVTITSEAYEAVPLELADEFATEFGLVGAAELAVRALRMA
jgi:translation initiation factor 2B subunit (eIF-2B alpha/beta/delta family)